MKRFVTYYNVLKTYVHVLQFGDALRLKRYLVSSAVCTHSQEQRTKFNTSS